MKLSEVVEGVATAQADVEVISLADSTTDVTAGSLFFCVPGAHRDGHDFAEEAVARGAVAVVIERPIGETSVPQITVDDVRAAIAPMAANFYGHPGDSLLIAGITGTNGKTTTAHVLTAILTASGKKTATIGTLSGQYTSPPAIVLQRALAEYCDAGYDAVVMEVSSHALVQHRVDGIRYRVAAFTNLSQDHLDYHKTMDEYFAAKAKLFEAGRSEVAVINGDDAWGQKLIGMCEIPDSSYEMAHANDLKMTAAGSTFTWNKVEIESPLVGPFNVMNVLAAMTCAEALQIPTEVIANAIKSLKAVPGRVERIDRGQEFTALVDFAHTPDGLEKILGVARSASESKVIVVFGCGGDRDAGKRPQMGKIASALADLVVVTSDNPRSEDPDAIITDILAGIDNREGVTIEPDRQKAISIAVGQASAGDVVLVAGKGHEVTQEIKGIKTPFDDRLMLAAAIDTKIGTAK